MKITPKIQKAIDVASILHQDQFRKAEEYLPYISHPYSVAWILSEYTDNENIIAAGILHDTLEDVKYYSPKKLKKDFDEKILHIVQEVSENKNPRIPFDEKATWEKRKTDYVENLKNASFEGLMVAAADKIHNMNSFIRMHKKMGENIWQKFNAPNKQKILWYYEEIFKILKEKLKNNITNEYHKTLISFQKIIKTSK